MIFDRKLAMQQALELLNIHSHLHLITEDINFIELAGNIFVNRTAKGFSLCNEYKIKIVIPIASEELPHVFETGHCVDKNYPHRYTDGELCLETDASIRIRFIEGFSLTLWMSEYVETYFFSYEYYQRYGEFPFGERGHGIQGIIETYEDLFNETDIIKILKLMKAITSESYRGHILCPCGSDKKLRMCHRSVFMKYYMDDRMKSIIQDDYYTIMEEIKKQYEQRRNSTQTK